MDESITLKVQNAFTGDVDSSTGHIHRCGKLLFEYGNTFDVRLIRISCERREVKLLRDAVDLADHLQKTSEDDFKLMSFFQGFSLSPLKCSENAMLKTMHAWSISTMFIDVLVKFGDQPQVFQESSGFRQSFQGIDGSFELCYQLMYVEPNGRRPPRDPWSFRQTGVYHRYGASDNRNCAVMLHPNDEAKAYTRLESFTTSQTRLEEHPLNIHLVVISTYMVHWQEHVESLACELEQIRRHINVADTTAPDVIAKFTPDRLQSLRHIEDKIMCKACRCLKSTIVLVQTLLEINKNLAASGAFSQECCQNVQRELQLFEHCLQGHINAVDTLNERVQATLGLLTDLINIGNQANSRQISTRILRLTQEGVDDNATVKVITVCTLIYLPASFVASFLGMNLFDFKESNGSLHISPQFWVFVATTIPLTMLTIGVWYMFKTRANRLRKARYEKLRYEA